MSAASDRPVTRKRLRQVFEQLANDRKLDILSYAASRDEFTVGELKEELDLPHTTAHEYCRDLQAAGLLVREREKPAAYAAAEFELHLSLDEIAESVASETETLDYAVDRYGDGVVDDVLDAWERVEAGEFTYREASAAAGMEHADFLRVASELELLDR